MLNFQSLLSAKTPGGTIYYSPHKPTIEIQGEEKVVAFHSHFIDALRDRVTEGKYLHEKLDEEMLRYARYTINGHTFSSLYHLVHFETVELRSKRSPVGVVVYNQCDPAAFTGAYPVKILEELPSSLHYYRVGYGPVRVHDGFAVIGSC